VASCSHPRVSWPLIIPQYVDYYKIIMDNITGICETFATDIASLLGDDF
jgi:hypothetical protein